MQRGQDRGREALMVVINALSDSVPFWYQAPARSGDYLDGGMLTIGLSSCQGSPGPDNGDSLLSA